jgi:hypothetical protein
MLCTAPSERVRMYVWMYVRAHTCSLKHMSLCAYEHKCSVSMYVRINRCVGSRRTHAATACMYLRTCVAHTCSVLVLREEEVEEKGVAVRSEG